MTLEGAFRALPRQISRHETFIDQTMVSHSSALIRAMAGTDVYGSPYDGIDVMVETYLKGRVMTPIDFGSRDLSRCLDRELAVSDSDS
jgi:hypothetical protein